MNLVMLTRQSFACMYRNVHRRTHLKPVTPKAASLQYRMKYADMNVAKAKQRCGYHMDKILSGVAMGVWSRSPEQGCVRRSGLCQPVGLQANGNLKRCAPNRLC